MFLDFNQWKFSCYYILSTEDKNSTEIWNGYQEIVHYH